MNRRIIFLMISMILIMSACSKENLNNPAVTVTDNPSAQSVDRLTADTTNQPENPTSVSAMHTEELVGKPDTVPTNVLTTTPSIEPTTIPNKIPGEDEELENFAGYYKMIEISSGKTIMSQEYFDIFEKHGIFLITMNIKEDGYATVTQYEDSKKEDLYIYDDFSFKHTENNNELLYVFKKGQLILLESSILGNAKSTFVKMTDKEISILEKGFSDEEFSLATEEASKYLETDEKLKGNEYISYLERSRKALDEEDYLSLYYCAQLAICNEKVAEKIHSGHPYRIVMTKEGTMILMDGKEVSSEDLFYLEIAKAYRSDFCETVKIRAKDGDEYIIDIDTDLNIIKTKAPDQEQ